jgi:hypothetical protein
MKKLFFVLFLVLVSTTSGWASTIPDKKGLLGEVAEVAQRLRAPLQFQLLADGATLEAKIGNRDEALTKLQSLRKSIKNQFKVGSLNSLSAAERLLYLAWQQGNISDWNGQKITLSLFRQMAVEEKIAQNVARLFFQKYAHRIRAEQKASLRPILKELSFILTRVTDEAPDSLNILILQNMLIRAFAALGEKAEILNIIRSLEDKTQDAQNNPGILRQYQLIISKASARVGDIKKVQAFLEKRRDQIIQGSDYEKIGYGGEKLELAEALIDSGFDQDGTRLFKETLAFMQPFFQLIKDSKRPDIAVFLMPVAFRIANIQGKLGRTEQVEESLKIIENLGIPKEDLPTEPLVFLVEYELKTGDIEKARKTAQRASPNARLDIAMLQARYVDINGAKASYKIYEQDLASNASFQAYLKKNKIRERDVFNQEVVRTISCAIAMKQNVSESYFWARQQTTNDLRAFALLGTLKGLIER